MTKISIKSSILFLILVVVITTPSVVFGQSIGSKAQTYWLQALYRFGLIKQIEPTFPDSDLDINVYESDSLVTPNITDITPAISRVGKIVTINGSGFRGLKASDIHIENGVEIAYATILPNRINFVTPNIKDGVYDISVIGSGGESNKVKLTISKYTSIIKNKNNSNVQKNTSVNYYNQNQSYQVYSNTPTVEQESHVERRNVQSINSDDNVYNNQSIQDQTESFPPRIVRITPNRAKPNDPVELLGVNFSGSSVELSILTGSGGVVTKPAIMFSNQNKINFNTPLIPAGEYKISVKRGGAVSNEVVFSVIDQIIVVPEQPATPNPNTPPDPVPVVPVAPVAVPNLVSTPKPAAPPAPTVISNDLVPKIISISPTSGSFGNLVTITGLNFTGVVTDLLFITNATGSISPEIISKSSTSITFKLPNIPAGIYKIYLAADGGISNEVEFSVFMPGNQASNVLDWFLGFF